ncbi:MAG: hypothetical protein JW981_06875 [Anaerolineae bacterium]|nr:hypothetical protein [Anaerolineae bacterium]
MKNYGRASVSEFLGDFIVYRNLVPQDSRLPTLDKLREKLNLPQDIIPRKSQPAYARIIKHMLEAAHNLTISNKPLKRVIYIGDTQLNDGQAFINLCNTSGWQGIVFIGSEQNAPPTNKVIEQEGNIFVMANHWSKLRDFERISTQYEFPLDEQTALILDLDKTTLGARGRNDHVINLARVTAVQNTVGTLLGKAFDQDEFEHAYNELNQTTYHPFTTDNQDYLAYICLIIGSDLYTLDLLVRAIKREQFTDFKSFITAVDNQAERLPQNLRQIHNRVYTAVQQGDPTPFKAFRYNEYRTTIAYMGCMGDATAPENLLANEIVITQEVREMANKWKAQGVLLFGLSDKPDEASIPTADLQRKGYRPIHHMETHAVGE